MLSIQQYALGQHKTWIALHQAIYTMEQIHFMFSQIRSIIITVKGQKTVHGYVDGNIWNTAFFSKSINEEKVSYLKSFM